MLRPMLAAASMLWVICAAVAETARSPELRLATDKPTYVTYEPVVVTFTLRNITNQSIEIPSLSYNSAGVAFEIADEGRVYRPYATGPEALMVQRQTRALASGKSVASEVVIVTNSLGKVAQANPSIKMYEGTTPFPFARPGKYFIRASIALQEGERRIQSNALEITIVAPEPSENILEYFQSAEDYAAAVGADYTVTDISASVKRWESFVRIHPESLYTPFVAYHLGHLYLHGADVGGTDPHRAVELYNLALKAGPKSLKDDSLVGLAKSQVAAGRLMEAKSTAERLVQSYPESERVDEARRIKDGLAKGDRTLREIYGR